MDLSAKLKKIRVVILDIDGVLTDGAIGYGGDGMEVKFFDVKDGHAIKMLQRAGLVVGVISGRGSAANRKRAEELKFDFLIENAKDKLVAFEEVLESRELSPDECLYMGDDVIDLPVLLRVGVSAAPADSVPEVLEQALLVTAARGGHGAVREVAVRLLKEQGLWEGLMEKYQR